jgi:hypothetical protein
LSAPTATVFNGLQLREITLARVRAAVAVLLDAFAID